MLDKISYNPTTGVMTRLEDGFIAGSKSNGSNYYVAIRISGVKYWVHRLAYETVFGPIP